MRIPGYCSINFLDDVTKQKRAADHVPLEQLDQERYHLNLLDLIAYGLHIHTDVTQEKILERIGNPYIKHLIKNLRISSSPADFAELKTNEDAYFSTHKKEVGVYMLSTTFPKEKLSEFQTKSGYYFLSPATQATLFDQMVESFQPSERKTWAFAKSFLYPHHSLIIADPYLFKEVTTQSCMDLLQQVVPTNCKSTYHLTLIGASKRRGFDASPQQVACSVSKIQQTITRVFPKTQLEYHIYNPEIFHDRYIISNNACIFSGYGLDIIKSTKGTTKESTWTAFKPFGKVREGNEQQVFFYKVMLEKLCTLKSWIAASSNPCTNNPLFSLVG